MPRIILAAVVFGVRLATSVVFENQGAAIFEGDFLGTPRRALVETFWIGIGGIPGAVEPVELRSDEG